MRSKFVEYDGLRFYRDDKRGYYLSTRIFDGKHVYLHRYVYQKLRGEIPEGYEIHHKDLNKANNNISNLQLIKKGEHQKLHGSLLTDEQKQRLHEILITKAVPASKKWHCSEEGHKWHLEHAKKTFKRENKVKKICEYCGKEFWVDKLDADRTHFCSNKCKSAHRRQSGVDNETRICQYCGKEFTVNKYRKTKYCSKSCAAKARWVARRQNQTN